MPIMPPCKAKFMKYYILLFFVMTRLVTVTYAQLPNVSAPSTNAVANIGQLVTQLVGAIKPGSFTSAWDGEKANWMQKTQSTASDAQGIAGSVASLAGFIKPDLFKQGYSAQGISELAQKVTSLSGATTLLKTFEEGLKPKAYTDEWQDQRGGWQKTLDVLQQQ
jgi:hypothetical protein